jgi:hypothetical protein
MIYRRILASAGSAALTHRVGRMKTQRTPINFFSSGSGGMVPVIKFSQQQGFFKKQGLDMTMI